PAYLDQGTVRCEIGAVSTVTTPLDGIDGIDVVLRPHEVDLVVDRDSPARVRAAEYRGAFVLHTVELGSGRTLRSVQPHSVMLPVDTPVAASVLPGVTPTVMAGNTALACG